MVHKVHISSDGNACVIELYGVDTDGRDYTIAFFIENSASHARIESIMQLYTNKELLVFLYHHSDMGFMVSVAQENQLLVLSGGAENVEHFTIIELEEQPKQLMEVA